MVPNHKLKDWTDIEKKRSNYLEWNSRHSCNCRTYGWLSRHNSKFKTVILCFRCISSDHKYGKSTREAKNNDNSPNFRRGMKREIRQCHFECTPQWKEISVEGWNLEILAEVKLQLGHAFSGMLCHTILSRHWCSRDRVEITTYLFVFKREVNIDTTVL